MVTGNKLNDYNCLRSASHVLISRTGLKTLTEDFTNSVGDFNSVLTRCFCETNMDHGPDSYVAAHGGISCGTQVR